VTLGVPPAIGAITALSHQRFRKEIAEVVDWVRLHNPEVRIVESLRD
jgi:hypothetical protein